MKFTTLIMMVRRFLLNLVSISTLVILLGRSTLPPADSLENIRAYTREIEFDYITWTINALQLKASQKSVNLPQYLPPATHYEVVLNHLSTVDRLNQINGQIEVFLSDPDIANPHSVAEDLFMERDSIQAELYYSRPLVETIIQDQTSSIIAGFGLGIMGQPIPLVLYKVTATPLALIISPRNIIRQDADISLSPELTLEQMQDLENDIEISQDVSALVVRTGGIALYPTMVTSTTNLPWLLETVCHEWAHNYLTLRPLGVNYYTSPELRTMNETTASIVGKEIGYAILEQYYPQHLPRVTQTTNQPPPSKTITDVQPFDFRKEMHLTRITVDQMLAANKIEEAEDYMESRRRLLWENGYYVRRLNQAYFAFHGAYADEPGGAAGADPVGPTVRALREKSASLAEFLNRISWMTSFDQLKRAIDR